MDRYRPPIGAPQKTQTILPMHGIRGIPEVSPLLFLANREGLSLSIRRHHREYSDSINLEELSQWAIGYTSRSSIHPLKGFDPELVVVGI